MQFVVWFVLMVASYFISQATAKRPQQPDPAKFSDFNFPQATEGTPQAVVFGDCWCSDWTVVGLGNFRTSPVKSGGGKK